MAITAVTALEAPSVADMIMFGIPLINRLTLSPTSTASHK